MPGYLYAPQSRGTNQLIHAGAHIYLSMDDVLRTLSISHVDMQKSARLNLPPDATEASLYALLGREPMHVDEIQEQAELPVEQVTAVLTIMELKGLVRQVGSMRSIAIFEEQAGYSTSE